MTVPNPTPDPWFPWTAIVHAGWGPTLRAVVLLTVPMAVMLVVAGLVPAVCTTVALLLLPASPLVRRTRLAR